jgi:5-methylcytosine-specific restriction protein A
MPGTLLRSCTTPGCPHLSRGGRCDHCRRRQAERFDARRGSAAARGYDARWTAFSARLRRGYSDAHGRTVAVRLCGDRPLPGLPPTGDSVCRQRGWIVKTAVVDHIVPVSGPNDPRFYDVTNMQGLCHTCHNAKRQRESRATGHGS